MAAERKAKSIAKGLVTESRKKRGNHASNSPIWTVATEGFGRIKPSNKIELIKEVRKGVPSKQIEWLSNTFGLSKKLILSSLGLSNRTVHRRSELLTAAESEKVLQLTLALCHAEEVLGSTSKATEWIQSINVALDGASPISLLDTSIGFLEVMTILDRIDYGVYS